MIYKYIKKKKSWSKYYNNPQHHTNFSIIFVYLYFKPIFPSHNTKLFTKYIGLIYKIIQLIQNKKPQLLKLCFL